MFDFVMGRKQYSEMSGLVEKMATTLAIVEAQLEGHYMALSCMISRMPEADRKNLAQAMWDERCAVSGYPAWMDSARRDSYDKALNGVIESLMDPQAAKEEWNRTISELPQSN